MLNEPQSLEALQLPALPCLKSCTSAVVHCHFLLGDTVNSHCTAFWQWPTASG
jgi:hypothetical protein